MKPFAILWAFWKEVQGVDWEDADLLEPIHLEAA